MLFYAAAGIWFVVYVVWLGWFVVRGTMETIAARARAALQYFIVYAVTVAVCAFLVVPIAVRFLPWWLVGLAELLVLLSGLGRLGQVVITIATAEVVGPRAFFADDEPVTAGYSAASEARLMLTTPPPWPNADTNEDEIEPLDELRSRIRLGATRLGSLTEEEAAELWDYLVGRIGLIDPWLGNRLAQLTELEEVSDQGFVLSTQYAVARKELEQASARAIMEHVARTELGRSYRIFLRSNVLLHHQDTLPDSRYNRHSGRMPQVTIVDVRDHWSRIRQTVRASSRRIEALLASADPLQIDDVTLTLVAAYDFHRDGLNKDDTRKVIEEVVQQVLGRFYRVRCVNQAEAQELLRSHQDAAPADEGWGDSLAYAEHPGDNGSNSGYGSEVWSEFPRDFANDGLSLYRDGEDEDDFPPLEVYNDAHIQELREILQADLSTFGQLFPQGEPGDQAARAAWLQDHPEVADYLEWYDSEHGAQARKEARDKPDAVLEHYLFWTWV